MLYFKLHWIKFQIASACPMFVDIWIFVNISLAHVQ